MESRIHNEISRAIRLFIPNPGHDARYIHCSHRPDSFPTYHKDHLHKLLRHRGHKKKSHISTISDIMKYSDTSTNEDNSFRNHIR